MEINRMRVPLQHAGLIGKLLKLDLRPLKKGTCINIRDLVLLSPVRVLNALKLELRAFLYVYYVYHTWFTR